MVGTGLAIIVASILFLTLVTILYYLVLLPFKCLAYLLRRPRLASPVIVLLAAVLIVAGGVWFLNLPTGVPQKEVVIKRGASVSTIGDTLQGHGLIRRPFVFALAAKAYGLERKVKAGKYALDGRMSTVAILKKLSSGQPVTHWVTIPEGLARAEIAALLQQKVQVDSTAFMHATNDSDLCQMIAGFAGLADPPSSLEGYLFPDTYDLFWGSDARPVIQRMLTRFKEIFADSLRASAQKQRFSIHQIVTLASLIEKEAQLAKERPWISAVFRRRLKKDMPLQADPTVQYALGAYRKRLSKEDLEVDSPYNTYRYSGLPPGPIANPGRASILAALYPADLKYLYFVAKGDGSHIFSKTLRAHLAAKRKVKRERKDH